MSTPFSRFSSVQKLLQILLYRVACFEDNLFKRSFFTTFQVSPVFVSGTLDSSCRYVSSDVNVRGCFLGMLELRVFLWPCGFMRVLALLPVWYYDMELTPLSSVLLLLSAFNMARSQEKTSTN